MNMGPKIHPEIMWNTSNARLEKNKEMKDQLFEKEIYLTKPSIFWDNQ